IALYCRDSRTGIDHAVRCYALTRKLPHFPLHKPFDLWGETAGFRRDLELVSRIHGILWFGPEQSDGDPARLAQLLGLPYRVVEFAEMNQPGGIGPSG